MQIRKAGVRDLPNVPDTASDTGNASITSEMAQPPAEAPKAADARPKAEASEPTDAVTPLSRDAVASPPTGGETSARSKWSPNKTKEELKYLINRYWPDMDRAGKVEIKTLVAQKDGRTEMSMPDAGSGNRQKNRTELEMDTAQGTTEHRAARPTVSPNTSGAAPVAPVPVGEPIDTGIVAAATAKQQAEGIKRDTLPVEPSTAPKPPDQGQAPQADDAAVPNAPSAPTSATTREFLLRVLPFPSDDELGYINLHVMGTGSDGKKFWSGVPTRDVDQFLQQVHKALTRRVPPDIYMCLSRQAKTGTARPPLSSPRLRSDGIGAKPPSILRA